MQGQAQDLGGSWLAANDLNFSERYLEAVKRVTPTDLQRVARAYLAPSNRTLFALLPTGVSPKAVMMDSSEVLRLATASLCYGPTGRAVPGPYMVRRSAAPPIRLSAYPPLRRSAGPRQVLLRAPRAQGQTRETVPAGRHATRR